jgi:sugar phosphate isomerase/epimerase
MAGIGKHSSAAAAQEERARPANEPFGYCLNLSTIRGQKLPLAEEIEIAAKAGYQAIEPWMNKIDDHVKKGGSLRDLGKRIADLGLTVESAIGFAEWIVDDDARRARGLEQAKRDMAALREIGGKRIAAPPAGATDQSDMNLFRAAERYAALVDLGEKMEVIPQVEVWGFSKCLSRLGETTFVAVESGRTKACILPDVYHIYKGGSDFAGLGLLSGSAVHVFHVNDYPAEPKRDTIGDSHRVYPGDGVAPLSQIFRMIHTAGFRGYLSLELFNPQYWKMDALEAARTGLEKTRESVQRAFA